jgi:hypothetical protein
LTALFIYFGRKENLFGRKKEKRMKKLVALCAVIILLMMTVSVDANLMSHTDNVVGLFNLVADRDLIIPQFDSTLGMLNSVSITVTTALQASLGFENTNPTSGGTFYVSTYFSSEPTQYTRAKVDLSFNSSVILTSGYTDAQEYTLSGISIYDGITDYAGTSGRNVATFGNANSLPLFHDSGLAQFIGTGNLTFGINSDAYTALTVSGGNSSVRMATTGQAGVTVVYDFTPIPEPVTICLLGLGALSLIRRKK